MGASEAKPSCRSMGTRVKSNDLLIAVNVSGVPSLVPDGANLEVLATLLLKICSSSKVLVWIQFLFELRDG